MSAGAVRCVRIDGDGSHLVRAVVHPPARPGRGRRERPVPVGRRTDRARDHRGHRHVQPPGRFAAPEGQGQAVARRPDAPPLEPRRRLHPRRPGRVRGPRGPAHRGPHVSRRCQGRDPRQADRVRHRARRAAYDPSRRHRSPADRREARRYRHRRHRVRADRRCTERDPRRRTRRAARSEDRRPDAAVRGGGRVRRGARPVLPRDERRAGRPGEAVDHDLQPARGGRHGSPGAARQGRT